MSLDALMQTMADLNEVHETLLELAGQKKHVLIHNQVEQLMQIVTKENKLLKRIDELDQRRIEAIGAFMIEKGYKPNPKVTVSDLTKIIFNIDEKKLIMDAQKRLRSTIQKLREQNQLNQKLIEHSLAFINYSLDMIAGAPEDEVIYQNPQQVPNGIKRQSVFDSRA